MIFKMSNRSSFKRGMLGTAALALPACIIAIWFCRHASAEPSDTHDAAPAAVAGVAKVTREDLFKEVQYMAEFRPYQEVYDDRKEPHAYKQFRKRGPHRFGHIHLERRMGRNTLF